MIKYFLYTVTLDEVPNEICLTIYLSKCPCKYPECNRAYLQKDIGQNLVDDLSGLLEEYKGRVTCICFMGDGPYKCWWKLYDLMTQCRKAGLKIAHCSEIVDLEHYNENIWTSMPCNKAGTKIHPCNNTLTCCDIKKCPAKTWQAECLDLCEKWLGFPDYIKVGPYIEKCGGLRSCHTNQRIYKCQDGILTDITSAFWDWHKESVGLH